MLQTLLVRHLLLQEPDHQRFPILDVRLAEAEEAADLGAVVLDRAAAPVVPQVLLGRHAHLLGEMDDHRAGDLLPRPREAPVPPEHFEQHGEAQPCRACLVGQQRQLIRRQRPLLNQFILVPLPLHRGTPLTRVGRVV